MSSLDMAEQYPRRPVRIIVGWPEGGPMDIAAGLIGSQLSSRLGQSFVVENHPGESGNIATRMVVQASPDGMTLLLCGPVNAINTTLFPELDFDFIRDIRPVAVLWQVPLIVEVSPSLGISTVPELLAMARREPGKLRVAYAGRGTAMLQLARDAGLTAFGADVLAKHDLIRRLGATPIPADPSDDVLHEAIGDGVDFVFDPLGGESLTRSLHALKPGGMLVAFGFQNEVLGRGGSIPIDFIKLKLWDWLPNGHATAFYSIGAMRRKHPDWFREDLARLLEMLKEGRLSPVVADVLPLEGARRAHELLEAGEVQGKIVLRVSSR